MNLDDYAKGIRMFSVWKGKRFDYTNFKIRDYEIVEYPTTHQTDKG